MISISDHKEHPSSPPADQPITYQYCGNLLIANKTSERLRHDASIFVGPSQSRTINHSLQVALSSFRGPHFEEIQNDHPTLTHPIIQIESVQLLLGRLCIHTQPQLLRFSVADLLQEQFQVAHLGHQCPTDCLVMRFWTVRLDAIVANLKVEKVPNILSLVLNQAENGQPMIRCFFSSSSSPSLLSHTPPPIDAINKLHFNCSDKQRSDDQRLFGVQK